MVKVDSSSLQAKASLKTEKKYNYYQSYLLDKELIRFLKAESSTEKLLALKAAVNEMKKTSNKTDNHSASHLDKQEILKEFFEKFSKIESSSNNGEFYRVNKSGVLEKIPLTIENLSKEFPLNASKIIYKILSAPKSQVPYLANLFLQTFEDKNKRDQTLETLAEIIKDKKIDCNGAALTYYFLFNSVGIKQNHIILFTNSTGDQSIGHAGNLFKLNNEYYFTDQTYVFPLGTKPSDQEIIHKSMGFSERDNSYDKLKTEIFVIYGDKALLGKQDNLIKETFFATADTFRLIELLEKIK
jgi:hypothetical protein